MTLDESIIKESEIAKEYLSKRQTNNEYYNASLKLDGEYHSQLAEWLKDYKRLKEKEELKDGYKIPTLTDGVTKIIDRTHKEGK